MSDDFDADAAVRDAIAKGVGAEDQYFALSEALEKCVKHCNRVKGIVPNLECQIKCMDISHRIDAILGNAEYIDKAIFGESGAPRNTEQSKAQSAADKLYDMMYWQYAGKSRKAIEAAYDDVIRRSNDLPSRRPAATALFDILNDRGYNPPILPWPPVKPIPRPNPDPEEPIDLGG